MTNNTNNYVVWILFFIVLYLVFTILIPWIKIKLGLQQTVNTQTTAPNPTTPVTAATPPVTIRTNQVIEHVQQFWNAGLGWKIIMGLLLALIIAFVASLTFPHTVALFANTIQETGYKTIDSWSSNKKEHEKETGAYVPKTITANNVVITNGSSEKGSWTLYEIPIKKGFSTKVHIKKPGAGKYSIAPEGMILYASKPGNATADVVINTSEKFNLPNGEYCFSAEKDFIQNGSDSCVIQIWAWDTYNKK